MGSIINELSQNKIFINTIAAWLIAQAIKVILGIIYQRKFDFRWFIGTGGMPSAHAAGVTSLAVSIGYQYGFNSAIFALAAVFAIVVMFDAQGVRRATGRQARILNRITEDIYWKGKIAEARLWELIGHTPIEVIVGFLLGVVIAIILR